MKRLCKPHLLMLSGWAVLTLLPALVLASAVSVFPRMDLDSVSAQLLFWITSTGTAPYGVISVIFVLVLSYRKLSQAQFLSLFLTVSLSMFASLGLNQYLKPLFNEPRPNAVWLEQAYLLDTERFYLQPEAERRLQMTTAVNRLEYADTRVSLSPQIERHWQHEVGFAFPSGHTLFAVTLTLVASYYLLMAGSRLLPGLLLLWSLAMGVSRMLLGMHWPQDVLASTLLGGMIGLSSLYAVHKALPWLQAIHAQNSPKSGPGRPGLQK